MSTQEILINPENEVKYERKDPTSYLPEEPMSYEFKVKKKKKKKKYLQEDPFKDISDNVSLRTEVTVEPVVIDPEVNIKVENIEVELDFNDFADQTGLMLEGPQSEESQEPVVKLDPHSHEAVILTFESVVNDRNVLGYQPPREISSNVCNICHLVFQSPKTLLMHQKRKHQAFRKAFKNVCDHCGMAYDQKNSLAAHLKRKHGPNAEPEDNEDQTCEVCALVFKGKTRLRMHMRRKHGAFKDSFKHECNVCGLTYDKHRSLIVHMQRKHSKVKKPVMNQWYNCPFCPRVFSKRETYARHVQRNHKLDDNGMPVQSPINKQILENCQSNESGEMKCHECPLVFSSIGFLKLHMRRKHNALRENFKLKCKFCNLSYEKAESLKRHVLRKHGSGSRCDICNKQFGSKEEFLNHSHVRVGQECSVCGLIFASRGGLAKHMRCTHKKDSPRTEVCLQCNKAYHDKRTLKMHLLRDHLKKHYTCSICNKDLKSKESHRRHVLFQHPLQNLSEKEMQKCEHCEKEFIDEFELCRHINKAHCPMPLPLEQDVKHEENQPSYQCLKCSDTYPCWDLLKIHYEQNHQNLQETQCQKCGEFVPISELQKHIKCVHSDVLECKFCDFKTKIKASMTQHTLRHKNATTIHCQFPGCRYKSYYEAAMKKHLDRHKSLGVKLQCSKCPFQTMNKYVLRYHEEAHVTGKNKYTCEHCNYSTTLPANLVQHKYKHSTEKKFKCEFCPFATKYNTSLRFHVKNKHCDLPTPA